MFVFFPGEILGGKFFSGRKKATSRKNQQMTKVCRAVTKVIWTAARSQAEVAHASRSGAPGATITAGEFMMNGVDSGSINMSPY